MKDKKAKTINKNAEKQFKDAETKLNKISKQMFESEKLARAAVESIIKKQKFLAIDTITVESHEKWGRGRRKADAKPLKIEYSIKATAKIDQMAIEKALFNHLGDFGRTFQKGTSSSIEAPFRA